MGEDNEDVHVTRWHYMTPLVQMEEAKRQFNRGQAAENRERQMARDNEREYEVIIPENDLETADEPVEAAVAPPRTQSEPLQRIDLALLNYQVIIPLKKDKKSLLHNLDLHLESMLLQKELEKSQQMNLWLYHPTLPYQVMQLQIYPPLYGHLCQIMKKY